MAIMLGALYRALLEPNEENARHAEVAGYESRLSAIDARLTLLQWMVGFLLALSVGNLWLTITILGRLPR